MKNHAQNAPNTLKGTRKFDYSNILLDVFNVWGQCDMWMPDSFMFSTK